VLAENPRPHRIRASALLLPSLVLALAPKCPLCLLAWAGALGVAPLISPFTATYGRWLIPLTVLTLALPVAALTLRGWRLAGWHLAGGRQRHGRLRGWGPAALALLGAGVIFAGKFWLDHPPSLYLGMALLFAAALLGSRLEARRTAADSPDPCQSCSWPAALLGDAPCSTAHHPKETMQ